MTGELEDGRSFKKKRKRQAHSNEVKEQAVVPVGSSPHEVINISSPESTNELFEVDDAGEESDSYRSSEFEDVSYEEEDTEQGDISVVIRGENKADASSERRANICSTEERQYRIFMHEFQLLCLMTHGFVRNRWINSTKLHKKLSRLASDKLQQLLHPMADSELSLRSTRKLLDGLRLAMEIWQKHWKVTVRYDSIGCYMRDWSDLLPSDIKHLKSITKQEFIRSLLRGRGTKDMAAQGFVAFLRSCNVNARLVMSCQPPDFTNLKISNVAKEIAYNDMTKYPIFWCEVWDKFSKSWITVDPSNLQVIEQVKRHSKLEPKGVACCTRNIMRYVIAFDRKEGTKDITRRYVTWFNAKTRKKRITKDEIGQCWYGRLLNALHMRKRIKADDYEDEYFEMRNQAEGMPNNLQDMKNHPLYISERDIRVNQVLKPGETECGYLKLHGSVKDLLKIYRRDAIIDLKSPRQWYMEGRVLKIGARSLKQIHKKASKLGNTSSDGTERLYSIEETELYQPPLADTIGEIEKNAFGNIEIFVSSMIPANCCLIESACAIKAANFLQIPYARAVTGFKFERGGVSKPNITGIVVANWYRDAILVMIEAVQGSIEDNLFTERETAALSKWSTLLSKLLIKKKLSVNYGDLSESEQDVSEPEAGGFIPVNKITDMRDDDTTSVFNAPHSLDKNNRLDDRIEDDRSLKADVVSSPNNDEKHGNHSSNTQRRFSDTGDTPVKSSRPGSKKTSTLTSSDQHSGDEIDEDYAGFLEELGNSE